MSLPRVASIRTRRGDVRLGLLESLKTGVVLEGETLDVQNGVLERDEGEGKMVRGEVGEEDGQGDRRSVHARAPVGGVVVRKQSWQEGMRSSPEGTKEEFPRWASDVGGPENRDGWLLDDEFVLGCCSPRRMERCLGAEGR